MAGEFIFKCDTGWCDIYGFACFAGDTTRIVIGRVVVEGNARASGPGAGTEARARAVSLVVSEAAVDQVRQPESITGMMGGWLRCDCSWPWILIDENFCFLQSIQYTNP